VVAYKAVSLAYGRKFCSFGSPSELLAGTAPLKSSPAICLLSIHASAQAHLLVRNLGALQHVWEGVTLLTRRLCMDHEVDY
jgi:hypothetical protein